MKATNIIKIHNTGNKARLWNYLNKGIFSKEDKINVIKNSTNSGESGDQSELFEYYKFNSRQWDDNSDIINTIGNKCYKILITVDNYINTNRYEFGGYNFYATTQNSGDIYLKAFKVLAVEDKSWMGEINDKITKITKSEYDMLDDEY